MQCIVSPRVMPIDTASGEYQALHLRDNEGEMHLALFFIEVMQCMACISCGIATGNATSIGRRRSAGCAWRRSERAATVLVTV
jgi:hypothetical protein